MNNNPKAEKEMSKNLVSFDMHGTVQVLDDQLLMFVSGGDGEVPAGFELSSSDLPMLPDAATNYVCAHNLACAQVNAFCPSNLVCDRG